MERYSRQTELLGESKQQLIGCSKVLIIGSGGLGSPTILALCAAGIGHIGIVDNDVVDISNLNRQIIHNEGNIGILKTESARSRVNKMNSSIKTTIYSEYLTTDLAISIFDKYDIIIDCVDNFETRKIVSKVAIKFNKPVIEAGIEGLNAFVQIIIPHKTPCFNCLVKISAPIYRQTLGAATGIVGNIQALECIKLLCGLWDESYNYISLNLMSYDIIKSKIKINKNCCVISG